MSRSKVELSIPADVRGAGPIAELVWMLEQGGYIVDSRHGELSARKLVRKDRRSRRRSSSRPRGRLQRRK